MRAFQNGAVRLVAVGLAAFLAFVLFWAGTVGLGLSGPPGLSEYAERSDTAAPVKPDSLPVGKTEYQASGEASGEETVDGSDPTDASFAQLQVGSFTLVGTSLEFVGSETTRSRRVVACVGARGPPVG